MPTDERNQMDQPFLLPRLLSVDGRVVWHSITGPAFFDYRPFFRLSFHLVFIHPKFRPCVNAYASPVQMDKYTIPGFF